LAGLGSVRTRRPLVNGSSSSARCSAGAKSELTALVETAGLKPVDDPSNRDPRHDRVRMREWLKRADGQSPSASLQALPGSTRRTRRSTGPSPLAATRITRLDGVVSIDPTDVPARAAAPLAAAAFAELGAHRPRGPELSPRHGHLGKAGRRRLPGLKLQGGPLWRLRLLPPRR
jgi:tRNA(Ile)-lysidine synthase